MTKRARRRLAGLALGPVLGLLGTTAFAGDASAECLRRIYNRSGLVLVASQDGGPPAVLMPGQSLPVVLAQPGRFTLSAYCTVPSVGGDQAPVTQASFAYEAVQDRCFVVFGSRLFTDEIGRGFFGTQGTAPFTLNNPRQGDVILGPVAAPPSCAVPGVVLNRRG